MTIKAKMLIPGIALALAASAAILISNILLFSDFVDGLYAERIDSAAKIAAHHLEDLKMKAYAASSGAAESRVIASAIKDGRPDGLDAYLSQTREASGLGFCALSNAEGEVIARAGTLENYANSAEPLASVRSALAGKSAAAVEEVEGSFLALVASAPIFDETGALLGALSSGYRLDSESFVDIIKETSGCEASVLLRNERVATTVLFEDGSRALGTPTDEGITEALRSKGSYTGRVYVLGRRAVTASYAPLMTQDGRIIGSILVGRYVDEADKAIRAFIFYACIISIVMAALITAVLIIVAEQLVKPIRAMTGAASALASGDTEVDIRVDTNDEMRTLADAFNSMLANTREQIDSIEHIAKGEAASSPGLRSEKDAMNRALGKLNETIRAQAEAIREEHSRVQIMLDATPLASRLWSRDLDLIECNEAAVKLFGLRDKKEYLERYFELSPEFQPDGEKTQDKIKKAVIETFEKGGYKYECMYRLLDGTIIPAENTLVRVPYGDGYVVAAYSRDLREYKEMISAIEQRDELLQIVNQAIDILLRSELDDFSKELYRCMGMMAGAINADRMYLHKNHAEDGRICHTRLHEWSKGAEGPEDPYRTAKYLCAGLSPRIQEKLCRGESVHSLVSDMPSACRECLGMTNVLSVMIIPIFLRNEFWGFVGFENCHSERLFTRNEEAVMRSGSLLVASALLRNEYTISVRDTSAQLEAALTDAKEANRAKSSFLAHMSHEIRTPLNAVIGFSELTLDDGNLSPGTEANLEKIYSAGSSILSIVNDILDISKIESGKFELYPVQYDTPSLINDTAMLNIVRIGEKPITFKLYVDENLPGSLFGDDIRVKQIFNNLLSNAFKYTSSGTVEWRISFERDNENIWIVSSVQDSGVGMKAEGVKKLFSDYNQVDTKANRKVEGTGLGLAITKRLVELMSGSITVESEYGKGSTFRVRFRQAVASQKSIGGEIAGNLMNLRYNLSKRAGKTRQTRVNLSYAHILVVDDMVTNLDVVKGMMKPYKIKIDYATSGPQAIEMIRAENPRYNAVFMDHMMPDMDGIEATKIIRENVGTDYARNIPIIALTANAIVGNAEMFLRNGFQDFVSKPIDMTKLDAVLRRWVRNKELEKELVNSGEEDAASGGNADSGGEAPLLEGVTIGGLDKEKALESLGGDESIFIDILHSYASSIRPLLVNLSDYLSAGNLEDYAIVVHGIKGATYGIAAEEAGDAAKVLEFAAKAGDLEKVKAAHPDFVKTAESLLDGIDAVLAGLDSSIYKPLAAAPDPALLKELREACKVFDMDRVDAAMESLESFRYEAGTKRMDWLREQVDSMAFETISDGRWPSE